MGEGDVTVGVTHSTLNYKDGLAVTGSAPVVRKFPLIAGIDFAGHVLTSADARFRPGDAVVANGWGMGETHQRRLRDARAGEGRLAGASAAQIQRRRCDGDRHGRLHLDAGGDGAGGFGFDSRTRAPVLVTGAAGGVGGVAIALLAKLGYRVIAATGRMNEAAYLRGLGAAEVIDRAELNGDVRPLAKERWAGAVDSGGLENAGECVGLDELWRRGGGVRIGAGDGSAGHRLRRLFCAA